MTEGFLLDTNHLGHAVTSGSVVRKRIAELRARGVRISTAQTYGSIYNDLKRRGRVLSQVDMMLASLARQMNLTIVTSDRDFAALADLSVENWLTE